MLGKVQLSTGLVNFRGEKPPTTKLLGQGQTPPPEDNSIKMMGGKRPEDKLFKKFPPKTDSGDEFGLPQDRFPRRHDEQILDKQIIKLNNPPKFKNKFKKVPAGQVPTFDMPSGVGRLSLSDLRALRGTASEGPGILEQLRQARAEGRFPAPSRPTGKQLDLEGLKMRVRGVLEEADEVHGGILDKAKRALAPFEGISPEVGVRIRRVLRGK